MAKFIENGCNNFFKLMPIKYNFPIYCYCPNICVDNNGDIPYIIGNIYVNSYVSKKLKTSRNTKITPFDFHISNEFSYKDLTEIYIPKRIEMQGISDETEAVEFINKINELYVGSNKK